MRRGAEKWLALAVSVLLTAAALALPATAGSGRAERTVAIGTPWE